MMRFLLWSISCAGVFCLACASVHVDPSDAGPGLALDGDIDAGRIRPDGAAGMPDVSTDSRGDAARPDAGMAFDPAASEARYQAWRTEMEQVRASGNVPGVSLVVVERGAVRHAGGLGIKRQGGAVPVSAQTLFRVGSISKPVTAAAVLSLVAEGRVELDSPLAQQLAGFGATPRDWADQITPRQLLTHTAGYPNYPDIFFDIDEAEFEANDALHLFLSRYTDRFPLDFEPGTDWAYSNFGFAVLGWLAADAHGAPFETTMQARVFAPFAMEGATFVYGTATQGDYASGHALENGRLEVLDYELTQVQAPFASLLVSADGLGAFMVALLARRDRAPWSGMFIDGLRDGLLAPGNGMGLSLFVTERPHIVDHSGSVGGFQAYMMMMPEANLGIGLAINSDDEETFEQMMTLTTQRFVQ
jgi:CubicO group peptidase (beta-lactamase class C family)